MLLLFSSSFKKSLSENCLHNSLSPSLRQPIASTAPASPVCWREGRIRLPHSFCDIVSCIGQRLGPSSRLCSKPYSMAVRHGHLTLNSDFKRRIDASGNKCLRRIMGYRWYDSSNRRLLRETDSRPITCTVRERQLRLYGHVARYPKVDPAHQAVSVRDNPVWRTSKE